jgi:hypothetical protein
MQNQDTLGEQNDVFFNVKIGCVCNNHRALISKVACVKYCMQIYAKLFCLCLSEEMLEKCLFRTWDS